MRLQTSIVLLAAASSAYALRDASPFFLLSTEKASSLHSQQLASSAQVSKDLTSILSSCDSSHILLVEHPGLRSSDLRHAKSMPALQKRLRSSQYKAIVQIPEVVGDEIDIRQLGSEISEKCSKTQVRTVLSEPLAASDAARQAALAEVDALFAAGGELNGTSHTIVYVGVPGRESELQWERENEPPLQNGMHTDLKRDVDGGIRRRKQTPSKNPQDGLPLFEKYQFLSPGKLCLSAPSSEMGTNYLMTGIFMGLVVFALLFSILYVGVSAIAGLEVSYMSFSKEMGPQAQKKQQ